MEGQPQVVTPTMSVSSLHLALVTSNSSSCCSTDNGMDNSTDSSCSSSGSSTPAQLTIVMTAMGSSSPKSTSSAGSSGRDVPPLHPRSGSVGTSASPLGNEERRFWEDNRRSRSNPVADSSISLNASPYAPSPSYSNSFQLQLSRTSMSSQPDPELTLTEHENETVGGNRSESLRGDSRDFMNSHCQEKPSASTDEEGTFELRTLVIADSSAGNVAAEPCEDDDVDSVVVEEEQEPSAPYAGGNVQEVDLWVHSPEHGSNSSEDGVAAAAEPELPLRPPRVEQPALEPLPRTGSANLKKNGLMEHPVVAEGGLPSRLRSLPPAVVPSPNVEELPPLPAVEAGMEGVDPWNAAWRRVEPVEVLSRLTYVSAVEEGYNCTICYGVMTDACMTTCGHSFCLSCLANWEKEKRRKECPSCRVPYVSYCPNYTLRTLIDEFKICCPNAPLCQATLKRGDLALHMRHCSKSLFVCGLTLLEEACAVDSTPTGASAKGCEFSAHTPQERAQHRRVCEHFRERCSFGCGAIMSRKEPMPLCACLLWAVWGLAPEERAPCSRLP